MRELTKVLIVDASPIFRLMLSAQIEPHCEVVLVAGDCREARRLLEEHADLDLVLSEWELPDGDGLELLDHLKSLPAPRPRFMLVTGEKAERIAFHAKQPGALACLSKPTSFREIIRVLRRATPGAYAPRAPRRRVRGEALVLGSRGEERGAELASQVRWELRDISVTGAFFETRGPVQVRTELELFLVVGEAKVRVRCEVVRLQEPAWAHPGGVGVAFRGLRPEALEAIRRLVREGRRERD